MDLIDDEIIQLGINTHQQASILIRQAIAATTTHEKDKIINDLKLTWKTHSNCMQQVQMWNGTLNNVLSKLNQKEAQRTNEYIVLKRNTRFLKAIRKNKLPNFDLKEKIDKIKEVEADIVKQGQNVYYSGMELNEDNPYSCFKISEKDTDSQLMLDIKLKDLTFKRLESLAYALKKRSFTLDDSEDLSLTVSEKFGNLYGMINEYEDLKKENQELKEEELLNINNPLIKRRNTSLISTSLLTDIVLALQTELYNQHFVGNSLLMKPNYNNSEIDFPAFCKNLNQNNENTPMLINNSTKKAQSDELNFLKKEFSTNINSETINDIVIAQTPLEKLNTYHQIIYEQELTIKHIIDEISPLRLVKHANSDLLVTQEREHRLWIMNDKFLDQIKDIQDHIEEAYQYSRKVYSTILHLLDQKRLFGISHGELIFKYQSLRDTNMQLLDILDNNENICNSLSHTINAFGFSMMFSNPDNVNIINSFFKNAITKIENERNEIQRLNSPRQPKEEEDECDNLMKMHKNMMKRNLLFSKGKKQRRLLNSQDKISRSGSFSNANGRKVQFEKPNPISNTSKAHILNYLSKVNEIMDSIKGERNDYHSEISGKLHFSLGELRYDFYNLIRDMENSMRNSFSTIKISNDNVLRIQKMDVEIDSNMEQKQDHEAQTEDESTGKVKPPTKEKTKSNNGRKIKK
ncbi:hypothetical protein TRFO_04657 [Tritrichomonas foetus]|uniref:Uncharacterized protein n=1 Tax=Tritrichomonas foetus TaxID=1144522 RepID=A0A1J4KHE1_9EUKA|nr:hypothetical protein TRFO_04657 [Tritrichomonas foetus]|eukprot:OHT09078.1 hypothetical protein TRFO_04657 [Tritrichomonas foetus]